jgi:hypothetical protein
MTKKIWLELIDNNGDVKDKIGSFSNLHFVKYFCELLELGETGEKFLTIDQCQEISGDIYSYLASIDIPSQIDNPQSIDMLGRAYAASTIVVKLIKLKPGNNRFKGFNVIWG